MSLTNNQQSSIINLNSQLTKQINLLTATSSSPGQDAVNLSITASYISNLNIISAISAPIASYKTQISNALSNVTTSVLDTISNAIDILSTNINIPNLPNITDDTVNVINEYNKSCINFDIILSNAMKSLTSNNQSIPNTVANTVENSITFLKNNSLKQVFDTLGITFIIPIQTYIEFLLDMDIANKIYILQNFEKCLMNPDAVNRPRQELFYPGTTQYNSQYFLELFCINTLGKIQYGQINPIISNIEKKLDLVIIKIYDFLNISITPATITVTNELSYNTNVGSQTSSSIIVVNESSGKSGKSGSSGYSGYSGINPTPTNHTSDSVDYALAAGETIYRTFTAATSVLLHVGTVEGIYELEIIGQQDGSITNGNDVIFTANNTTNGAHFNRIVSYNQHAINDASGAVTLATYHGNLETDFHCSAMLVCTAKMSISTYTKNKQMFTQNYYRIDSTHYGYDTGSVNWFDTSTVWSSLGTLTFPFAQSGRIIIKRIL